MRKSLFFLTIFCTFLTSACFAQRNTYLDSLCDQCHRARSDTDRVVALSNLANYYYGNKLLRQGDSVLNVQLRIAELSNNNNLVLKTYFDNSIANIGSWSTAQDFNKALDFTQRGIDFAKRVNNYNYAVIGYTRLATILRKSGRTAEAVTAATTALTNVQESVPDSIKALAFIELGDSYQSKGVSVLAMRNYNNAFDIAIKTNNYRLESFIYHRLFELYVNLDDMVEAKDYLLQSVTLNKKYKDGEGLIKDYLDLARLEDDQFYVTEVLHIIDSLRLYQYNLRAKNIMLAIYMVRQKDTRKALEYMHAEPELKEYFMGGGLQDYYFQLGEIYRYAEQPDSAIYYFKVAETELLKKYDIDKTRYLYFELAACYEMKKEHATAISYYEKSLVGVKEVKDLVMIVGVSNSLSRLYKESGDFKNALVYKDLATSSKDSLSELAKNKDLALMSVEREKRQHDEEVLQMKQTMVRKKNLQYMFITIAICLVFILTLVLGMFPISRITIKILGYFFFISLFEFIVLVLDNDVLHPITHGEPLKLWLIKIVLIAMLVPLQHGLEHRLTKFLESRKLLKARTGFSIRKWWPKKKIPAVVKPIEPEKKEVEKAAP